MSRQIHLQRQFHALTNENQVLRAKAKKINEIQTYANILIQSTQNLQQQLTTLQLENKQLKNHIERLMSQNLILQQNYSTDYKALEADFKRQINKKQQEIRMLLINKQKDQNIFQQTLNESQNRSKNQFERIKTQMNLVKSQYEAQIKKLVSNLNQKSQSYENSENQKAQIKKQFIQEISNISLEINKLQKAYQQSQTKNSRLIQEIQKLSKLLQQLSNIQNLTKKQLTQKQQESKEERQIYEKKIKFLEQNLNELKAIEKKNQFKIQQLQGQYEKLRKQHNLVAQKLNEANIELKRLERMLNQQDQQTQNLKIKIQLQQEQFQKSTTNLTQKLKRMDEQLILSNERLNVQRKNSDSMKVQIEDLLNVIDKLQQSLSKYQHSNQMLDKQNAVLFKEVQNLNKQIDTYTLKLTDMDQMNRKAQQNASDLQQILKKQKIRYQQLEKYNNQILQTMQALKKQQKQLQQIQIREIIEKSLAEKRQIIQNFRLQKQAIVRKYEFCLRQKDQQAKNKLFQLEDQITLIRMKR